MLIAYLMLMNACACIIMLTDKQRAKNKRWRIPEVTLLGSALLGGSVGALVGMYLFRHKTRHPKFTLGIPLIIVAQILGSGLIAIFFL